MIDRAPVTELREPAPQASRAHRESQIAWNAIEGHQGLLAQQLSIGAADQFTIDENALRCRVDQFNWAMAQTHVNHRGTHELGIHLSTTVSKIEQEFAKKNVLDAGCGVGKLGGELERKGKARFTYLDSDAEALTKIHTRTGIKVIGNALNLPFEDGRFDRTVGIYAGLIWTPDPVDCLATFLEQLRATKEGGSAFTVPLFNKLIERQGYWGSRDADKILDREGPGEDEITGMKVWDMQDYLIIDAIKELIGSGYIDMTWVRRVGTGANSSAPLETYSAIFDIKKQVGRETMSDLIAEASEVAYPKDASTQAIIEKVLDLPTSELDTLQQDHEIWEGGIEGAGFKITRHNLPLGINSPFIVMSASGREPARTDLIAKFTRALGEPTSIEPGSSTEDPTMIFWMLDPEIEKKLKS